MARQQADGGLDFEALRLGIERCDPDLMLGLYADDARLSIVHAGAPRWSPFELHGKAEIFRHLRTVFGQDTSHRVERVVFGEDRVTFWEACGYPDGDRVRIETTLEVRDGEITHQVDVVTKDARSVSEGEIDRKDTKGKAQ